jgi:hypothetical protein
MARVEVARLALRAARPRFARSADWAKPRLPPLFSYRTPQGAKHPPAQNALSLRKGLAPRNLALGTSSATAMHLQSSAIIRTLRTRRPALIRRTTSHLASGVVRVFAFVRFHRSLNPCELVSMFTA